MIKGTNTQTSPRKGVLTTAKKQEASMFKINFRGAFGTGQHFSSPMDELKPTFSSERLGVFTGTSAPGLNHLQTGAIFDASFGGQKTGKYWGFHPRSSIVNNS